MSKDTLLQNVTVDPVLVVLLVLLGLGFWGLWEFIIKDLIDMDWRPW